MTLSGITVVSLAVNLPGPLAAAQLAGAGAHVIKIEPPQGDALASGAPGWYAQLCDQQEVLPIDLGEGDGAARLQLLLADADVLLTSSRPASLAKFGLVWSELHASFPRLCHVAIVGEFEERAGVAGHDLTYQAQAGLLREPRVPSILAADILASQFAVSATFELLYLRERTGAAGSKEVAIAHAARAFSHSIRHGLTAPGGILGGGSPFYNVYAAADGWIAVAALEPKFRERIVAALGLESEDRSAFEGVFAAQTCAYWEALGRERDIPLAKLEQL